MNEPQNENFNYDLYWERRGSKIRSKLLEREKIFFDWITPGSKILDIAAGNSSLPRILKREKNCLVKINDINEAVVENQKQQGLDVMSQDLSLPNFHLDDSYDYVIASEILEHLALPENLISQIKNNTKFTIISIPNSAFYKFRIRLFFSGKFLKQWYSHPSEHLRFWSHVDFLEWLGKQGLEVLKCQASNGLDLGPIKFYKILPNVFGYQMCYLVRRKQ